MSPAALAAGAQRPAPDVRSEAVLVIDAADDSVLLARNADIPVPIASITKLMTALVVLEAGLPRDEEIRITTEDRATNVGGPSRIVIGASLTRGELLHLALMSSENRAAHALGRSFPGGMPAILRSMNAKAATLGMTRTRFADTTGLSSSNVASPADLAKLVREAARHRLIREYSTDPDETVTVIRHQVECRNTNLLVRKPEWDIQIQKTGYTQAAGRCLVMQATIDDRPIVMVLLNSFGKYTRTADAIRIRRWMEERAHQSVQLASSHHAT
ncbi:D-alanyl-D-alanine endopeptidase (penicillin-binding protein 7) [Steroidobacter denitrificans]|uniref:D-alanyl-D-alanine endopeptidase (Penicillin-binding protein 7) n=1 Tax=Steroidobacter denitrificans TaxID=465721 RepID=A0A127FDE0_STEDE|nr:D-alanyl-D-alanine endopeptidase (penicillin-binding protein 7) [Steroidobacter denitrificans]